MQGQRVNIKEYGDLVKSIIRDISNSNCEYVRDHWLIDIIKYRYGNHTAKIASAMSVYPFYAQIKGFPYDGIYIIDNSNKTENVIREGDYFYEEQVFNVLNADFSILNKESVTLKDVGLFFDKLREMFSKIFVDSKIRIMDASYLTYFASFSIVMNLFNLDKKSIIKMQENIRKGSAVIEEDNMIFENMNALRKASGINYLQIARAYEEGMNNVASNDFLQPKVVPQVQTEQS